MKLLLITYTHPLEKLHNLVAYYFESIMVKPKLRSNAVPLKEHLS